MKERGSTWRRLSIPEQSVGMVKRLQNEGKIGKIKTLEGSFYLQFQLHAAKGIIR